MAAIASSRIATSSVFQKPQAKDAGTASGTDPSSTPFQQILSAATDQTAGSQATGRDSGKKSGKDVKPDGKTDQTQQAAKDQTAAANSGAAGLVEAVQAKDQNTVDETDSATPANGAGDAAPPDQSSASAQQQTAPTAAQILAAAQTALASQTSNAAANTQDVTDGANQIAASSEAAQDAQGTPSDASGNATDASQPSARKPGKDAAKELALSQIQAASDAVPSDAAQTVSSSTPVKDAKTAKPQDPAKDGGKPAASQTTSPDPSAMAIAAIMLPAQTATDPTPASGDTIAAAAISGADKEAAKNSAANSDPATGAGNRASGETANPGTAGGQASTPANNAAQSGAANASQNANGAQTAGNAQPASGDDKVSAPTHDQGSIPAPQPQSQMPQTQAAQTPAPQSPVAAVQPPSQSQTPAPASISQNVQVGPQDSSAAANSTLSALAVAIAAKSQSGTKQFDIRLDPPDLGRVEVRLSIDPSGKAQASLSADQPRTLDLLKTDAPTLTRALRDAGLNVSQNGLNFSLRGQDRQNGSNGSTPRAGRASQISLIATSAIGSVQGGANYQGSADGRLDIRV